MTPEEFLTGVRKPFIDEVTDNWCMLEGTMKHEMIQSLFPEYEQEIRVEKVVNGLTIVGKCDIKTPNEIWELKTSWNFMEKAKKTAIFQIKVYLSLFEMEVGRVFQPVETTPSRVIKFGKSYKKIENRYLKELGSYKRNDEWFLKEIAKLGVIDKKITEYYGRVAK